MTARPCQFCNAAATGTVTAQGLASPIRYCDNERCWKQAYDKVRRITPRTWTMIEPVGRRRKPGPPTDLFDLLPEEGESPHGR